MPRVPTSCQLQTGGCQRLPTPILQSFVNRIGRSNRENGHLVLAGLVGLDPLIHAGTVGLHGFTYSPIPQALGLVLVGLESASEWMLHPRNAVSNAG